MEIIAGYVGSVVPGFDRDMLQRIWKNTASIETSNPPFDTSPKVKEARTGSGLNWSRAAPMVSDQRLETSASRYSSDFRRTETRKIAAWRTLAKGTILRLRIGRHHGNRRKKTVPGGGNILTDPMAVAKELADGKSLSLRIELDGKDLSPTHLNKPYFTKPVVRKRDVLLYYFRIAPYILPFLKDRPLVLKRYPNGIDGALFSEGSASIPAGMVENGIELFDERKSKNAIRPADDRAD